MSVRYSREVVDVTRRKIFYTGAKTLVTEPQDLELSMSRLFRDKRSYLITTDHVLVAVEVLYQLYRSSRKLDTNPGL